MSLQTTEELCLIALKFDTEFEGELTPAFQKWHEEFGKLSQNHWKVSKLRLWWNPMIQSGKCMSLKFTAELCVMTNKWCKIWTGIDLSDQNWHEKTLTRALERLKSLHFNEAAFDESI